MYQSKPMTEATNNQMIDQAVKVLNHGGVIATPTESSYGLSCLLTDRTAIDRLYQLKHRPKQKGFIVIAHHWQLVDDFVALKSVPQNHIDQMFASWPGPVTWVVPLKPAFQHAFFDQTTSIAIRISQHPILSTITKAVNQPIISTSANLSSNKPATTAEAVQQIFGNQLDCVIITPTPCNHPPTSIYDLKTLQKLR